MEKPIKDKTNGKLQEIIKFVENNPKFKQSFDDCLDRLNKICENNPGFICELYPDFAPNSMLFNVFREGEANSSLIHGGFIFHGKPDVSLSVCLEETNGFRIHT
jgi:hypothetical protein